MQVANPNRAQFQKNSIFIPSDFPHFLKSTIGKELAPSKSAPVTPSPILLARWWCILISKVIRGLCVLHIRLHRPANDPGPQMIPGLEMIPKSDRK